MGIELGHEPLGIWGLGLIRGFYGREEQKYRVHELNIS